MDFVRKNWGLLAYAFACVGIAVFLALKIKSSAGKVTENHKKLDEQLAFFEQVKKDNVKLSDDNQRIAEANKELADKKFMDLRATLAGKYRIDPDPPPTSVEAVRRLQQDIRRMSKKLEEESDIIVGQQCQYFSFDKLAMSRILPPEGDVPQIFRQLRIIQEVVRLIAESQVLGVERIERPMGLQLLEEDLYTVTPLRIAITGKADQIQTFINKMHRESNYLFFLRKADIHSGDQAPSGVLAGKDPGAGVRRGGGMDGMSEGGGPGMMDMGAGAGMGMEMAPDAGGGADMMGMMGPATRGPGRGRTPPAGMRDGMDMMGEGEMGGPEGTRNRTQDLSSVPLTREELLAFEAGRDVTASLRFDLVEFIPPKEE